MIRGRSTGLFHNLLRGLHRQLPGHSRIVVPTIVRTLIGVGRDAVRMPHRKLRNQRDRTTGNLVAAQFVHTSSRELDPLLHTHCTVFNATFEDRERCWKARQVGGMYDAIRYGTAVYRNELAKRVQ